MKILIVTQKVDREDPILGFFHRWILMFASQCEKVVVIGQMVGTHELPENVEVHSLGKEHGLSKSQQIRRFWKLIVSLRAEYDVVFVHMTPVWVVLGMPFWALLRKPMYLWYEIRRGGWMLRTALVGVRKVFSATEHGLPFPSRKQVVVGHGIDTAVFHPPQHARDERLIVTVGRVTPVKRFDHIIRAFAAIPAYYRLLIGGGPIVPSDHAHEQRLLHIAGERGLKDRVVIRFLSEEEVVAALQQAHVFVHAAAGGMDKALLEAMSCGCPVLSAAESASSVLPPECCATLETLSEQLRDMLRLSPDRLEELGQSLRQTVEEHHSLQKLVPRLVEEMSFTGASRGR